MQANTPTPPRNRRAGRMSPLPPEPLTQAQPAASAAQPSAAQATPAQPYDAAPQQPYAAPVRMPRAAAGDNAMQPTSRTPYGYTIPQQPTARGLGPAPTSTRSIPAGIRPQTTQPPQRYRDDPEARRAAQRERQAPPRERPAEPDRTEKKAVKRRRTPAWLKTVLTLVFIGVLTLVTVSLLIMARITTENKEREAAWDALLSNYHVTTGDDGSLRVTWQDTIEHYADAYNLNPAFVTAVIRCESSFRTNAVSSVGARGLMQMMPGTASDVARMLGETYDFDQLYNAETSIRYGCCYLNYLADLFGGDTVLVIAAYHAGLGKVTGWLGDTSISPDGVTIPVENIPIPETRQYAERVTYAYGIYEMLLYPSGDADAVPAAGSTSVRMDNAAR